jgi:hypothetical protein
MRKKPMTSVGFWKRVLKTEFGNAELNWNPVYKWQEILKSLPNLEGQIIGGNTIIWGHKVSFKKFTNPILSKYGDVLSENAGMKANCTCGWEEANIIPMIIPPPISDPFQGLTSAWHKPQPDFQLLEELIIGHITTMAIRNNLRYPVFEEVEYTVLSQHWFEDMEQPGYLQALFELLRNSNAIVHFDFDTRNYLIIDDKMNDEAVAKLAEMLEGHPVGSRKVRVLRNA